MTTEQDMHDEVINNRPDETEGIEDNSIPGEEAIQFTASGGTIRPSDPASRSRLATSRP